MTGLDEDDHGNRRSDQAQSRVGRGRPPVEHQFKKGRSANPAGRPKGSRNLKSELAEELNEKISVREGGRNKRVTKVRAIVKTSVAKALQGSDKAASTVFNLAVKTGVHEEGPATTDEINTSRKAIFDRFRERLKTEIEAELRADSAPHHHRNRSPRHE